MAASSGTLSGSTILAVSAAALVSIAVTPANPSIVSGANQQFTATGTYTDGSTQNLTSTVNWSSSSPGVATISVVALPPASRGNHHGRRQLRDGEWINHPHCYRRYSGFHCRDTGEPFDHIRYKPAVHSDRHLLRWQHAEPDQHGELDLRHFVGRDDQ